MKRTGKVSRGQKKISLPLAGRFFSFIGKPIFKGLLYLGYLSLAITTKVEKSLSSHKPKKINIPKPSLAKAIKPKTSSSSKVSSRIINTISFSLGMGLASMAFVYFLFPILKDLPSPQSLANRDQSLTTKIFDRNGKILYKIYLEKNRTPVPLTDLPPYLIQATLSIEDKEFYKHRGLSLTGIIRAAYQNLILREKTGGSTITQQLIKNALLTSEKTWQRKIKEALLAVLVEKKYTKNQILEMYFNEVGFGGATYGIEEAAETYFGKHARDLSLAEAALLAGLPASPTRYSPFGLNSYLAKERQALVLKRMVEEKYLTEEEANQALAEKLQFAPQKTEIFAPHFVMYVKDLLVQKYGEKMVETGGLEVKTSLDLEIQNSVQEIVAQEIKKLGNLHITNGAALVTNPKTGEILAMVGSKDYFAKDIDGNVNVTTSLRQPGSSIKPVNYSLALENGFTAASLIDDSPITYQVPGQPPYSPQNYDHRFHGQTSLRIALGSSFNVPAVKILAAFGVKKMVQRGEEMGITTWTDPSRYGLSLTLGGGDVRMTDMAVVYGVLANSGIRVDLNPILEVSDSQGKILEKNSQGKNLPVLSQSVAYLLTNILADNSARTPAFGPNSLLYIPDRPVAVKTGTTQNMRDNWTIGYTPSLLSAVWVGNNDSSPMSYVASGVTGASPIWRKIMDQLLEGRKAEDFIVPPEIKETDICQTTNTLPCRGCPMIKKEFFILGTEPQASCSGQWVTPIPSPMISPYYPQ
ncbi:MAG: PBP1A family penicillin-binding protein [Patescibacteria group bacterium]|nr:PBP1A family penicillin-binding protein [Patescibacteria group bacterium]